MNTARSEVWSASIRFRCRSNGGSARAWVPYEAALAAMDARAAAIADGTAPELVWLLEHPPLYTAGTSAKADELIAARFPVHAAGRGGQVTYHGPGQRVVYLMLDLKRRGPDVRRFVTTLEEWIIRTLAHFNVVGERREDRIGVWVRRPDKGSGREDKIAAIGIRIKRWVTLHGVALNIDCDLSHYAGIVPCGVVGAALRRDQSRRPRPGGRQPPKWTRCCGANSSTSWHGAGWLNGRQDTANRALRNASRKRRPLWPRARPRCRPARRAVRGDRRRSSHRPPQAVPRTPPRRRHCAGCGPSRQAHDQTRRLRRRPDTRRPERARG